MRKTCDWCSSRANLGRVVGVGTEIEWAVSCAACWKSMEGRPVHQLIKARWVRR